ncbi:hypothetical protein D3C72_1833300 [compost metagenome]
MDRYLAPVSQTKVTTRFGSVCSRHQRRAVAIRVPDDEPARMPSFRRRSRTVAIASESGME